jgi:hypothetical protein
VRGVKLHSACSYGEAEGNAFERHNSSGKVGMPCSEVFELQEEHLLLLRRANVQWEDSAYDGAPAIDLKRPYGNSDIFGDIAELLDVRPEGKTGEFTESQVSDMQRLHRETATALQIILVTGKFEPGAYRQTDRYSYTSWEKVK